MLKRLFAMSLMIASIALVTGIAAAKELTIGDPAPTLTVGKFVKGTPVTRFEKGKIYVVEFWATWCGPCRKCIPHLTELQKKYKGATFIGVSIFEETQQGVVPFVKKMGAQMDYRVAMDSIPAGKKGKDGLMAVHWMQDAEQQGIPKAFLIDKQGRVAWIGHPLLLEEPLKKVVAGTWDMTAHASEIKRNQRIERELSVLQPKIHAIYQEKIAFEQRAAKVLVVLNEAIAANPDLEERVGFEKFSVLLQAEVPLEAAEYGVKLVAGRFKNNATVLNQLAWLVVDPSDPNRNPDPKKVPALVEMALQAALRAEKVRPDWATADTLAAAYFAAGKFEKAIETQQRALRLGQGQEADAKQELAAHLAIYKAVRK